MRVNVQKSFKGILWWGWVLVVVLYVGVVGVVVDFVWECVIDVFEEVGVYWFDLYVLSLKSEFGCFEILFGLVVWQDGVCVMLKVVLNDVFECVYVVNIYFEVVNCDVGSGVVDVIDL